MKTIITLFCFITASIINLQVVSAQTATAPSGSGTSGDPYLISNLAELYWVAASSSRWAAYYKQTADIDASGTSSWNSGAGWTTIGDDAGDFTGSYDGQGYTISGIYINRSTRDYVGLFGSITGATIKNLGLINASVTGQRYVGALVGYSYQTASSISNCFSTGTVSGTDYIGGLIGYTDNPIDFIVSNCYSHCGVTSVKMAGGLIGDINNQSTVINCYSTGVVSGSSDIGGLIGLCNGSVSHCFWNTQTSGQTVSAGGTGKTTTEMQTKSTFTDAGWDFAGETANGTADIWGIGTGYPYLTSLGMKIISSDFSSGSDDISAFTKTYHNTGFTITPASHNYCDIQTDGGFSGFYSLDYNSSGSSGTQFTISASGYSFDLSSFKYYLSGSPSLTITLTFIDGSTDTKTYTFTGASTGVYTFTNFTTTANDIKSIKFVSTDYMTFNNFAIDDIKALPAKPTVTTTTISTYDAISATMGGNVTADGGATVSERGVVYSSSDATPTIGETGVTKDANGTGTGSFSKSITGLSSGTYYVCAYAINTAGTSYGNVVSFTIQTTPTITWNNPSDIVYGTLLSATQLNATASVPGTFTYTPALGTKLNAGTAQNLKVDFTPTNTTNYTSATKTVTINVAKAAPVITWANPTAITYGTTLSATQLNATADVAGTFTYNPALGTKLNAGTAQNLKVDFTPTDATNYSTATKTVTIDVAKATPVITWAIPTAITYGTTLSATQLNATAVVAGTFTYNPALGTKLNAGTAQNLKVDFTPTDATNYSTATKTVTIDVAKATPVITWATPTAITYGTTLSATQLNATADVAGTFTYNPALGTKLDVGNVQVLKVDFAPSDLMNYESASKTVLINVFLATGISEVANNESIVLYPNPVMDAFKVLGINGKVTIFLTDLNGKVVLTKVISADENVFVSDLSSGIYLIKIITSNGTLLKKMVKE